MDVVSADRRLHLVNEGLSELRHGLLLVLMLAPYQQGRNSYDNLQQTSNGISA
jgi:hypothetical protein